ncbi:MAG: 3-phosphoshikimate 1-carboxyvinyltransferase, partial [Actinomycetia bacterium]|nr:3-phosphoshikimate 1-carboxyvinyltransferase [Actinomycetes bacterium]
MEIQGIRSLNGEIKVPGDKSISHRSAIISSITGQNVIIENYLFSQDCINTIEVLRDLGVKIEKTDNDLVIHGAKITDLAEPSGVLEVGNSGTSIRLMAGVLASTGFMSVISGDHSINNRPMKRIIDPLRSMGAAVFGRENNTKAPLVIFGKSNLKGKRFDLTLSSAQVKSCLLLAAINADGVTEIIQPEISRDHTERMLQYFDADIEFDGKHTRLDPAKKLVAKNIYIPGDISSAAFLIVATLILKGSHTIIRDVGINPTRSYFLEILKNMGANIEIKNKRTISNEPIADIETFSSDLFSVKIEKEWIPNIIDEIPVLATAAAVASGKTIIEGAGELRNKESDRISSLCTQLKKIGVDIREKKDGFEIIGNNENRITGGTVESMGDHRIAMSLAILSLLSKNKTIILDSGC